MVFGEDKMQYEILFPAMLKCGIDVYNCVLYNNMTRNLTANQTEIFHYLENNNEGIYWKKKKFTLNEAHRTYTFSAEHTSWKGEKGRTVYCIPLKQYKPIGRSFFENEDQANYWGKCNKEGCNGMRVLCCKKDGSNEFWGCTNYRNH